MDSRLVLQRKLKALDNLPGKYFVCLFHITDPNVSLHYYYLLFGRVRVDQIFISHFICIFLNYLNNCSSFY